MTPQQRLIECLRDLCARTDDGVDGVAAKAELSAESLRQVLAGTKLPSGAPRGIGSRAGAKLSKAFPGWDNVRLPGDATPAAPLPPELAQALGDLQDLLRLQPDTAHRILSDLHNSADQVRAIARRAVSAPESLGATPAIAASKQARHARSSVSIRLGDGNPHQGALPLTPAHDPFTALPGERELDFYERIAPIEKHPR